MTDLGKAVDDFNERFATHVDEEHVRPEIQALADRPERVTLAEWRTLRCNSWEFELLVPRLDDEAFLAYAAHSVDNCQLDRARPWRSYNEAVMGSVAPEALARAPGDARSSPRGGRPARELSAEVDRRA